MSIAIVTDSTADIPETSQIHVIPNIIVIDGQDYEDNKSLTRDAFYRMLPGMKSLPTTASAPIGSFVKIYEKLFQQGITQIISIHASSLLSGIYNAASNAAQLFGQAVQVVDSGQVTLGLGFQVLAAAEAISNGLPLEKILSIIADVGRRVRVVALLDTLEYVRRSGRVSWARARLGAMLNIKPMIELRAGIVTSLEEVRTRRKGIDRLLAILHSLEPIERLAILHTNAESEARQFLSKINLQIPLQPLIVNVTTVIGTHVGPNGLGFAVVSK